MRAVILLLLSTELTQGQPRNGLCAVTLRVVNVAGVDQPYRVMSFIDEAVGDSGVDYANQFQGLRGMVPCDPGLYSVEVDRADPNERLGMITRIRAQVAPWQPEQWLTLTTSPNLLLAPSGVPVGSLGTARPEGYVWKGRISPAPRETLWVYLRSAAPSSVVGGEIQAEVDRDGEFRVYGPFFSGPYILYVMNKQGQIVYLAPVKSEARLPLQTLEITLPTEHPASRVIR